MKMIRVAAAATTLSLVGAISSIGAAGAAPTGVGTSEASTTVLGVALGTGGQLLDLRLLADTARSTTDASVAQVAEAFSRLSAVKVTSAIAALNKSIPDSPFEARSPGGKSNDGGPGASLGSLLPLGLLTGTLNLAQLTSTVDAAGARSGLDGAVGDLSLIGNLLNVKGLTTRLTTSSSAASSEGTRAVKVDAVDLLPLASLLDGLGIKLADLLPSQLTGLLGGLKLDIAGIGNAAAVQALVDSLQSQVTGLLGQVTTIVTPLTSGAIDTVIGALPIGGLIPTSTVTSLVSMTDAVAQVNALVDQLQDVLAGVLGNVLGTLNGVSLLKVGASEFGIMAKASDTVANSVADVTGKLGAISIGGLAIPGLDVGAVLGTVTGVVGTVNSTLSSVLGAVNPGLANLVKVSVLDQVKGITTAGGYTKSNASLTGLTASIVPPANLSGIVGGIVGQRTAGTSAGSLITGAGLPLPALDTAMGAVNTALGVVDALLGGATLKVAEVAGSAAFTTAAAARVSAPTATDTLPRTGRDGLQLAAIGVLFIALGLGFRNWLRMAARAR